MATFLADDGTLEDALPFLAAFRRTNPDMRILAIPRSPAVTLLAGFAGIYQFQVLTGDFAALDLVDAICMGVRIGRPGSLRALGIFDIMAPAVIHIDANARVGPLAVAAAALASATTPLIALAQPDNDWSGPAAVVGLGGPRIGSAQVTEAVRQNLVTYLGRRPPGAPLGPLLRMVTTWLGVCEVAFDPATLMLSSRPDPRDRPVEIAALQEITAGLTFSGNGGSYVRAPGLVVNAPPDLAGQYAAEARRSRVEPPPAVVARLRNATVHRRGLVMSESGCLVQQSLINSDPAKLRGLDRRTVAHRDVQAPMVLLKQTWDDNYGHWLIESLPRVGLVAEICDLSGCQFLIGDEGGRIGQVYRDSLGLLGIGPGQIVASSDATRFCAELIYPAPLTVQPWVKAPRVLHFLQQLAALVPINEAAPRKLYISRNGADRRRLRNEAAITACLVARGYAVVEPQTLTFVAQIALFRTATHVVGNLGAALANLSFSPEGVRFLALTSEFMQDDFFWDLVSQRGGRYVSLHGEAVDPTAGMHSDFDVDLRLFRTLLDAFEDADDDARSPDG